MDTSKKYIKMCDKSGLEECCSYGIPAFREKVKYIGNNVFVELDQCSTTWRTVRLLRQSQIQEMMGFGKYPYVETQQFHKAVCGGRCSYPPGFKSFEQLWLAFYMLEKYSKIWNGEKWIKLSK